MESPESCVTPPDDIYMLSRMLLERLMSQVSHQPDRKTVQNSLLAVDTLVANPAKRVDALTFLNSPENRCAFLYRFLLSQVNIVRWSLKQYGIEVSSVAQRAGHIQVVSIGGGIGAELLGLAVSLSEKDQAECEIRSTFLEPRNAWEAERNDICAAIACGGWNTETCSVPTTKDLNIQKQHMQGANLICLLHSLTTLTDDFCCIWLPKLLGAAQPGAMLLLVDFLGPRMAEVCEIIQRAGFKSEHTKALYTPPGVDMVPDMEKINLVTNFKDYKMDWGTFPVLQQSSHVQVFKKPEAVPHLVPVCAGSALKPLLLVPTMGRASGEEAYLQGQLPVSRDVASPLCTKMAAPLVGAGTMISASQAQNSPRESGEIGSEEESVSIGVRATGQGKGNMESSRGGDQGGDQLGSDETPCTEDPMRDMEDACLTSDLTVGIQRFATYKVGSKVIVANSFSEAKQKALVEMQTDGGQVSELVESECEDDKPRTLEWIHCSQWLQKKQRVCVEDGFAGRIMRNNERRQIVLTSTHNLPGRHGANHVCIPNKENKLGGSQGQISFNSQG